MSYPAKYTSLANKQELLTIYKGKTLKELPTPSFVVDQGRFKKNSDKMLRNASKLGADFRAHVKTHKSTEGTVLQLGTGDLTTDKVVVSTMMEAWNLLPLIEQGLITDMLFSLPVVASRLAELADFSTKIPHLRVMLDNAEQLDVLDKYNQQHPNTKKWSIFVKINMGTNRAGLLNDSELLAQTLNKLQTIKDTVEVYGFYCHAGHSYASDSENKAKDFLLEEILNANKAAVAARALDPTLTQLQLSVGATPTAHASEILTIAELESKLGGKLAGQLELHAGNYPFCDQQQVSTGCVGYDDVSCKVIAEAVSTYPGRGKGPGEQLINAGVIALAREFGPMAGHGRIVEPKQYNNWIVGRLSQEHGILTVLDDQKATEFIPHGTQVSVIPQHSCITAAAYPWYYIVDGSDVVVDIWVPWRGW